MGGLSGPQAESGNLEKIQEQEEKLKKCVVHFRPKEGWKGGYGFDWFRLQTDDFKETTDTQGTRSMSTKSLVGKYMCPAARVKMGYGWAGHSRGYCETEAIDPSNFNADLEQTPLHFCRFYIPYDGMKIPVNNSFNALLYDLDGGEKIVKFSRKLGGDQKKKSKKGKKGKEKQAEEERIVEYTYTFSKGKAKELKVKDLISDNEQTYSSSGALSKASKKDKAFFGLKGDIIDDCWKNKNMNLGSLNSNPLNMGVLVQSDGAKKVELANPTQTITLDYEDGVLVRAEIMNKGAKTIKLKTADEVKKKGLDKGLSQDMIDDNGMDYFSLRRVLNYNKFQITLEYPKKFLEYPVKAKAETKQGIEVIKLESFDNDRKSEDGLLHEYCDDFFPSYFYMRDPNGQFNEGGEGGMHWDLLKYYTSSLAIPASDNKKYKKYANEAKIQVFINGEYDKITFDYDDKYLKVKPSKITSGSQCTLTIERKRMKDSIKIKALSEGQLVGALNVRMFTMLPVNVCFVNVRIEDTYKNEVGCYIDSKKHMPWNPSLDNYQEVFLQAGLYIDKITPVELTVDYSELAPFFHEMHPRKVIARDVLLGNDNIVTRLDGSFARKAPEKYIENRAAVKVYFLDLIRCDGEDFYIDGSKMVNDNENVVVYTTTVALMDHQLTNVIAHELGHIFGLEHSYHNIEAHTLQKKGTTNVMDLSSVKYSLHRFQWNTMRYHAIKKLSKS